MSKTATIDSLLGPPEFRRIAVGVLQPNPHQPRRTFNQASIRRLADSIEEGGQIQNILVIEVTQGSRSIMYIAAGEQRTRAIKLLKWPTIGAMVRRLRDHSQLDRVLRWYGLAENLNRDNLGPLEAATAFAELIETEDLTQAKVAELMDVDQSYVSVCMGIFQLEESAQAAIERGCLDPATVVGLVRSFHVPDKIQRAMVRAATKGGHKLKAREQREAMESVIASANLTRKGSGDDSAVAIAKRQVKRLIQTLSTNRADAVETATQTNGTARAAMVSLTRGDLMMLESTMQDYEDAFKTLRKAIQERRELGC